ncbi:MAG: hypothetical protein U5L74_11330 [Ideonella sp.]|nr:hypothetical protein [Ideonella sp.]
MQTWTCAVEIVEVDISRCRGANTSVEQRLAMAVGRLGGCAGALVLSWPSEARFGDAWPALAVLGAWLAWANDNNLTRKVALNDATWIAAMKGLSAGTVNLVLVLWVGSTLPSGTAPIGGLLLGLTAYGVSLALFVVGLRPSQGLRTPGRKGACDGAPLRVAFRRSDSVSTRIESITRLNGWSACTPVNASRRTSR